MGTTHAPAGRTGFGRGFGGNAYREHAVAVHSPLLSAMRHGVMNGGKRVRALAALAAAQLVGGAPAVAMQIAVALGTFTLIR